MAGGLNDLSSAELAIYRRRLDTPVKIQAFLDAIPYNTEGDGETFR